MFFPLITVLPMILKWTRTYVNLCCISWLPVTMWGFWLDWRRRKLLLVPIHIDWDLNQSILLSAVFCFFFLSWRLIALQYCSGFCHTLTWISRGCTCVLGVHTCVHVYAHVYLCSFMHALITQAPLQTSKCLSSFLTGNAPDYWYTLTFLLEKSRI